MIAFVSLFLGLALGVQRVEVTVAESVAAVELRLDGVTVARIEEAPWVGQIDLGTRLVPHRLEAVAFDEGDSEIGRVSQILNLPRPPAEAALVIEPPNDPPAAGSTVETQAAGLTVGRHARLTWESTAAAEPRSVSVVFDGRPVPVSDPRRFELPPHDPRQLHFLRAELDFSDSVSAIAEATFGGIYADQVVTEMTAVPVEVDSPRTNLSVASLTDRFRAGDQNVPVLAVENGPAEVVFVLDQSAEPRLGSLARNWGQRSLSRRALGVQTDPRFALQLDADDQMRFLWPFTEASSRKAFNIELFPPSPPLSARDGGVLWYLAFASHPSYAPERQRLADAVAVAGTIAAGRGRRRAVVLILGEEPTDRSQLTPAQAREFLSSLGVPLIVWKTHREASAGDWTDPGQDGSVLVIRGVSTLSRAVEALKRRLAKQRIAWLAGAYLPQAVEFDSQELGVERVR